VLLKRSFFLFFFYGLILTGALRSKALLLKKGPLRSLHFFYFIYFFIYFFMAFLKKRFALRSHKKINKKINKIKKMQYQKGWVPSS
jgi:hypothetical protein